MPAVWRHALFPVGVRWGCRIGRVSSGLVFWVRSCCCFPAFSNQAPGAVVLGGEVFSGRDTAGAGSGWCGPFRFEALPSPFATGGECVGNGYARFVGFALDALQGGCRHGGAFRFPDRQEVRPYRFGYIVRTDKRRLALICFGLFLGLFYGLFFACSRIGYGIGSRMGYRCRIGYRSLIGYRCWRLERVAG